MFDLGYNVTSILCKNAHLSYTNTVDCDQEPRLDASDLSLILSTLFAYALFVGRLALTYYRQNALNNAGVVGWCDGAG